MLHDLFRLRYHTVASEQREHAVCESLPFGMLLATAGGFLDSYTYIARGGVFCNAQTGNLVLMAIGAARGDLRATIAYFLPVLAFACGVLVAETIKARSGMVFRTRWPYVALAFEIAVLVALGLIPGKGADMPVTLIASFAASLQASSFNRLAASAYATTMCTGNLRSAVTAARAAIVKRDRDDLHTSARYWFVILAFVLGAGFGAFATAAIGFRAIWLAALALGVAAFLLAFEKP